MDVAPFPSFPPSPAASRGKKTWTSPPSPPFPRHQQPGRRKKAWTSFPSPPFHRQQTNRKDSNVTPYPSLSSSAATNMTEEGLKTFPSRPFHHQQISRKDSNVASFPSFPTLEDQEKRLECGSHPVPYIVSSRHSDEKGAESRSLPAPSTARRQEEKT